MREAAGRRGRVAGLWPRWVTRPLGWLLAGLWSLLEWLVVALWRRIEPRLPVRVHRIALAIGAFFSQKDRTIRRSYLASGFVHLTVLLVFTVVPIASRDARWEPAPMVVSLVRLSEPETPAAAAPPASEPEQPKPKPPPQPEKEPEPRPEAPKVTRPEPEPKPVEPAPTTPRETLAPLPSASHLLDMAARIEEPSFTFDYYLPRVVESISRVWRQPAGLAARDGEPPSAIVRFRIDRRGHASNLAVEERSELPLFDRSAVDAVLEAEPFPPLPPAYGGQSLTLHVRFVFTESRVAGLR